jgi:NADH-quinone oxidoreductase subunit E
MVNECNNRLTELLTADRLQEVDHWIAKYPAEQRQSAVMSTLRIVQEQYGHLTSELMDAVALYLNMPAIAVYEVASFYTMYETKPVGQHVISVCTNISCQLRGCGQIVKTLEDQLKIKLGETTADGKYTLRGVECLAACANAPAMQIDKTYHERLTPESTKEILESYS